ncbi:MAG: hypothetical protein JOZ87_25200 [Chloroflexi bacterium]|nr:hypothetical protein [Chloroflexota bacterium]
MDRGDAPASRVSLARDIVAAVQAVPGVAEVSHGQMGSVATCGGSERVPGVAISVLDDSVDIEIHVCAVYSDSLVVAELAANIREAIRQNGRGRRCSCG